MNHMKVERYEKWEPVEGVVTPAARALIEENHEGLGVTLFFSEIVGGLNFNLFINFGRVPAYTVHEEFVHPWNIYHTESPPMLNGKWETYCFPILIVRDSVWLDSFSDSQLVSYPDCIHYRLVTLDQTVDVLCNRTPGASWVRPRSNV
jgi:hypothetical protein